MYLDWLHGHYSADIRRVHLYSCQLPEDNSQHFMEPLSFNTVFINALHWSLSWAGWIQSTKSHSIPLTSVVILSTATHGFTLRKEYRLGVSENRVLRGTFRPKRDKVTEGWRKLHNEELHNLYSSSSTRIIRIIKSRRMKWTGHVARMGRRGMYLGYWWERQKERVH
jgi:hypothetical protein